MGDKLLQKALTIDEQIKNLVDKGLLIEEKNKAYEILNTVSYYRLVKAYSLEFKQKNSDYFVGKRFEDIVYLYNFNSDFSHLIFTIIEKVEVLLRCRISNYFSLKYGVLGYENKDNFESESYYDDFIEDIAIELKRNEKSPFVKNFRENYKDGKLPFYALIELFSFGLLSKFYKNMKAEDKKNIAKSFGVPYVFLESWIESLSFIRNACAHYGRIYNERLPKKPKLYDEDKVKDSDNDRVFVAIRCMSRLINHDDEWNKFKFEMNNLFKKYKNINVELLGFPKEWQTYI